MASAFISRGGVCSDRGARVLESLLFVDATMKVSIVTVWLYISGINISVASGGSVNVIEFSYP